MSDYTLPSEDGFIALYSEYLSLRSRAAKGRATRAMVIEHARCLSAAILRDATALAVSETPEPPSPHSRAWEGRAHSLERPPKDKVMRDRKWTWRDSKDKESET